MRRIDFSWKCPVCMMHQRKEPHRRLSEHMKATHNMEWDEKQGRYVEYHQIPTKEKNTPGT